MLTFQNLGRYGRFANSLFQIASTIGIATRLGYEYAFPAWINHDHKERFGSTEDVDLQKYFVNSLPRLEEGKTYPDFPITWGYHDNLHPPDNVSLSGHFQSDKYFLHCLSLVRYYFTMKDEGSSPAVAIHVRLGDYDNHYHPRLGAEYYGAAMKRMVDLVGPCQFELFSDCITEAMQMIKSVLPYGCQLEAADHGDYIQDWRYMKGCRHFITGNSSYSMMAAILADHPEKKVICPSTWFGPGYAPYEAVMAKDVYPQNAIVI